jgi:hypothetical protein
MPLIPFPDIPNLDGVPAIPRSSKYPATVRATLGLLQGMIWRIAQVNTRWGIWDSNGKALGDPSKITGLSGNALEAAGLGSTLSVGSLDYAKEMRISDFPVEQGSFSSYNKVETPATPKVILCMQGTENDRRSFLDAIDTACKSTDLYRVVTPELTYFNYSIENYSYSRSNSRGTTLLIVEITLREVRQVSAIYSIANAGNLDAPKDVGASLQIDNGKVQAQTPSKSTLKRLADNFPGLIDRVTNYMQGVLN